MLFGRSVFHSVVERLRAEADSSEPAEDPAAAQHRVCGLNASFAADTAETEAARMRRSQWAYLDILADRPEPAEEPPATVTLPEEPPLPTHLAALDEASIAAELAIGTDTTAAELNEKRRRFARMNHPDCIAAAFRREATIRMTIANRLIDEALQRTRR